LRWMKTWFSLGRVMSVGWFVSDSYSTWVPRASADPFVPRESAALVELRERAFGIVDLDPTGGSVMIRTRDEWEQWFRGLFAQLDAASADTDSEIVDYKVSATPEMAFSVVEFRQNDIVVCVGHGTLLPGQSRARDVGPLTKAILARDGLSESDIGKARSDLKGGRGAEFGGLWRGRRGPVANVLGMFHVLPMADEGRDAQ